MGTLPLLPLRSMTLLPGLAQPIELGRPASVDAIRRARDLPRDDPRRNLIVVATQRDPMVERPMLEDLYPVGVIAEVNQALQGVPGRMTAIVRGMERVRLLAVQVGSGRADAEWHAAHARKAALPSSGLASPTSATTSAASNPFGAAAGSPPSAGAAPSGCGS